MAIRSRQPEAPHEGPAILLVDDREDNLVALEAVLRPLGHRLLQARSGDEALKCLLKEDVAVILLDVQMPGMDGFETAAYIKQRERTRYLPIIFLTAINKDDRHVFRGYSAGAVDYIFKPFDPTVLRSKVSVFIELHRKTSALAESEDRFRKAFDHAPIGVALVDFDGRLLEVNKALCDMMGYPEATLRRMTLQNLGHPEDEPLPLRGLANELMQAGRNFHVERRFVSAVGEVVHGLISISYVASSTMRGPHFIVQTTDLTERRKLETFRDRFIANAAHELRTPVAVISGIGNLLDQSVAKMSENDLATCVTALARQSRRLTRLVNSLLDLTRLQEGRLEVKLKPVELGELIKQVVSSLPAPKGREVQVSVEEDAVAVADEDVLDQVVTNLLVNAFRYGGPKVTIDGHRSDGVVLLTVSDDGPGIPPELKERLFEPFTRGKQAVKVGGSGLGLTLVKSLTEAMGGSVHHEAVEPMGARFVVRLGAY